MSYSVHELRPEEIDLMTGYFLGAPLEFLLGIGVEPSRLPTAETWRRMIVEDRDRPDPERKYFYLLWEADGQPVGHSNLNAITFGEEATLHFHVWQPGQRHKGAGEALLRRSLDLYFQRFELQRLICEPYAKNPGPHRILEKVGFEFDREYETTPGWINLRQTVRRWVMTRERWPVASNG